MLFLIAEGRIGDFHTELEIVSDHHDRFIRYSIDLERDIMEGRYNKVWSARQNPPRDTYTTFVDKLMGTIRNDVASCIETSYENLTVGDAAKLLMFGQPNADFQQFCQSVRNLYSSFHTMSFASNARPPPLLNFSDPLVFPCFQRDWVIDGNQISYAQPSGQVELPATSLINQSLSYAHEIERII